MTVAFFGHRENIYSPEIKDILGGEVENLIKEGANKFLLGGYGAFDMLAAHTVAELKTKYPHIKSTLIIPYLNRNYDVGLYDNTLYPDLENVLPKMAISERNKWMVRNSDIIVCYVSYRFGGAYAAMQYAKKNNKSVLNVAEYLL